MIISGIIYLANKGHRGEIYGGFSIGVILMPRKPMKPCKHPGCPKLTDGNFCREHELQHMREYEKYDRRPEERKRYSYQWRKLRKAYVKDHPVCEMCLLEHRAMPGEEVHHIYPLDHGGSNTPINLLSLCKSCHSRITAAMGDRWNKREYKY